MLSTETRDDDATRLTGLIIDSRHITTLAQCAGGWGSGEPTFESYIALASTAQPLQPSSAHAASSQPPVRQRCCMPPAVGYSWVHLLLALVAIGCRRLVTSPLEHDVLQGTGQVWHIGGGHGSRDRYPTTRSGTNVSFSQTSPTYDWTLPPCLSAFGVSAGSRRTCQATRLVTKNVFVVKSL